MDSNEVTASRLAKPKRVMTDKQKAARCLNLAAGRKKRMDAIKQNKEKPDEYDISSNDGSIDESESCDSSDNDAFVLTKAKQTKKTIPDHRKKITNKTKSHKENNLRGDVDELKSMMRLNWQTCKRNNIKHQKSVHRKKAVELKLLFYHNKHQHLLLHLKLEHILIVRWMH